MFQDLRRVHSKKTRSSHDKIANTIGKEILTGSYESGATLPAEPVLMRRFKASRTVLREVMKTLSAKGLVSLKPRVGARVLNSSNWNYFDAELLAWRVEMGMDEDLRRWLSEVRTAFEPAAAALAARGRTREQVKFLRDRVRGMARSEGDPERFAEADLEFHLMIGVASRNPMIQSLAAVIETALFATFQENPPMRGLDWEETARSHGAIVDAIEAKDAGKASAAMLRVIELGVARAAASKGVARPAASRAAKKK
ncbi:MAG: FadR family transcriptional regulator [Hyphomonadaceae bacterium]|nr:FadR family transcriptional regulator [Hyphomonadaceae bacterium]